MRTSLLLLAAILSCAGKDVASYAGNWSGQARMWQGPAKPELVSFDVAIRSDGVVTGRIGGAECLDGRLAPRKWWQFRSFNRYDLRIDCALRGELTPGVTRHHGTIALIPEGEELTGWFFSEGHDGFPLFLKPTQARVSGLTLHRTP